MKHQKHPSQKEDFCRKCGEKLMTGEEDAVYYCVQCRKKGDGVVL